MNKTLSAHFEKSILASATIADNTISIDFMETNLSGSRNSVMKKLFSLNDFFKEFSSFNKDIKTQLKIKKRYSSYYEVVDLNNKHIASLICQGEFIIFHIDLWCNFYEYQQCVLLALHRFQEDDTFMKPKWSIFSFF